MHWFTQCPQPCSRPQLIHTSARDSSTLTGKSGPVSCGVTAPFSWVLVHTKVLFAPSKSLSLVLCKFWRLYGGVHGAAPVVNISYLFKAYSAAQQEILMEFTRQEYWSGLPFPPSGALPSPGIEPRSPALAGRFFTIEPPGKPCA